MALRVPWVFTDPVTSDVLHLSINPKEDQGSFAIQKQVSYSNTSGVKRPTPSTPESATVIYAMGAEPSIVSYAGNLYTQQQLTDLQTWFTKEYPIQIEDDLGRKNLVMIETFEVTRVRSGNHPWKHSYTFTGVILETL